MITWIAVGAGGALGALARAFVVDHLKFRLPANFPWPTFTVNIIACFTIGIVLHLSLPHTLLALLCVGFLGGFSTLSTMCFEAVALFSQAHYAKCALYLVTSYASCLLAAAAGFACVGAL